MTNVSINKSINKTGKLWTSKRHPHCHIVFNRVDNNGKTISYKNDRYRNEKVCKALVLMIVTNGTKTSTMPHPCQNNHNRCPTLNQGSPSQRIHSCGG